MLKQTQKIWEKFHLVRRATRNSAGFHILKDFSSFLAENDYLAQEYMAKDLISEENPFIFAGNRRQIVDVDHISLPVSASN